MRKFLFAFLLSIASAEIMASCDYHYSLNSLHYNCQIQMVGKTEIEQYAASCDCEDAAKKYAERSEAPISSVSNLKCKKAWVNINNTSQPDSKFHQFEVKTYLKKTPMTANTAIRTRYLKVRKSKCD